MNTLENLAKQYFEKYSEQETGVQASWYRLSRERQIAWMEYAQHFMDFLLNNFSGKLTNAPLPTHINTTFVQGRNEGINLERMRLKTHITELQSELKIELEEAKRN